MIERNLDDYLILVRGQDKTSKVASLEQRGANTYIRYKSGDKVYQYNSSNIIVYDKFIELNPLEYRIVNNEMTLKNFTRIQDFGKHIRVTYQSGKTQTFLNKDIVVMHSSLREPFVKDRLAYFRDLAHYDTLLGNDGKPILGKRFDKIDFVRDDSILSSYLRGQPFENSTSKSHTLYYPFGFNASQKKAVDDALNNRLSVIEGPPGTGKTQTILNIVANIVMRGQSVAVVSSNNSATENVEDKLKANGVDFIAAFLGSSSNKEAFLQDQKEVPILTNWQLNDHNVKVLSDSLADLHKSLENMLHNKNRLSSRLLERNSLLIEQQHFLVYYNETNSSDIQFQTFKNLKSSELLKLIVESDFELEKSHKVSIFKRLRNLLRFGIYNRKFYSNSIERIIAICQYKFYEAKLQELDREISSLEKTLASFDFEEKMKLYSTISMRLFRDALSRKYQKQVRATYVGNDLWKNSKEFIHDYPVILSTTHSLRSSLSNDFVYDYVIVDEASQVNLTTGVLAFSCAKNAVIVGDLKQLPNVVDKAMKLRTDAIFESYTPPEEYRYSTHSLLLSVTKLFPNIPRTILREHYRCSPKIINFCNQKYYDNQLIILTKEDSNKKPLIVYKSKPGNHARKRINQRQIDMIQQEIIPQQNLDVHTSSIGIVTPYRDQADALQRAFTGTMVKADTVDKFQGQERDVIIISTVDNDISDFTDDEHRLNVAVSRAAKQLIVVTNGNEQTRSTDIGDLVNYIQYNNLDVINSEIYSVFDLLYKQYTDVRRKVLAKLTHISKYDSENLMYNLILKALDRPEFQKYGIITHVPLRMILRDLAKLESDREVQFVMNPNTHIDILIYDKLSHQPVLAVEVDGHDNHLPGTAQAERDALKDAICARYFIPLERFRTTGSGEGERIVQSLRNINKFNT